MRLFLLAVLMIVLPAQVAPVDTVITNPTADALFPWGDGKAAAFDDLFALPYRTSFSADWLYLRDRAGNLSHVRLPDLFDYNDRANAEYVLSSRTDLWIWSGVLGRSTLRHYHLSGDGILPDQATLVSALPIGDHDTRPGGLIRLASGALAGMWYEHTYFDDRHIDLGFLYVSPAGELSTLYPVRGDGNWGSPVMSEMTLVQHPADGSIWTFYKRDSYHELSAARLIEEAGRLRLDWLNPGFISKADGGNSPEGEYPYIIAAPDPQRNTIRLAYQNTQYNFLYIADAQGNYINGSCGDPGPGVLEVNLFAKGAYVSVAEIAANGAKSFTVFPTYIERAWYFGLSVSDGIWLFYQQIGCQNTTFASLRAGPVYASHFNGAWSAPIPVGEISASKDYYASTILYDVGRPEFVMRLSDDLVHDVILTPPESLSLTLVDFSAWSSTVHEFVGHVANLILALR